MMELVVSRLVFIAGGAIFGVLIDGPIGAAPWAIIAWVAIELLDPQGEPGAPKAR